MPTGGSSTRAGPAARVPYSQPPTPTDRNNTRETYQVRMRGSRLLEADLRRKVCTGKSPILVSGSVAATLFCSPVLRDCRSYKCPGARAFQPRIERAAGLIPAVRPAGINPAARHLCAALGQTVLRVAVATWARPPAP